MPIIVSNSTIDVITRGLIKYRLITHASANTVGAELIRVNHLAMNHANSSDFSQAAAEFSSYERRPFPRKVKRAALDGAVRFYLAQVADYDLADIMPVVVLVRRLAERNVIRMEQTGTVESHEYGDVIDTDEGRDAVMIRTREEREEANRVILQERMAAIAAERAANPTSSDDEEYEDEDEYDDEDVDGDE